MKAITIDGVKLYIHFEAETYYLVSKTKSSAKFKIDKK
jgi:hypothetical protein